MRRIHTHSPHHPASNICNNNNSTRSIVSDLRKTTDLEESKLLYIKSVIHQHTTTICFFCVMGGITIFA